MIEVAAFTPGLNVPSARFRIRQYGQGLEREGVHLREYPAPWGAYPPQNSWSRPLWAFVSLGSRLPSIARSFRADVTVLQREMIASFATLERWTRAPRVLDVDDAIFLLRGGAAARALARACDSVICGNRFLAENFSAWNPNTVVIPTAVDTDRFRPAAERRERDKIVIGWSGSSNAFGELERIELALSDLMKKHPQVHFVMMADRLFQLRTLPADRFESIVWSESIEVPTLRRFDIGLMPLADTDWNRGKCSYKMLLYMACGIPSVVSPVGMNRDMIGLGKLALAAEKPADWYTALDALVTDGELRETMGHNARVIAEQQFSVGAIAPRLAEHLKTAVRRHKS